MRVKSLFVALAAARAVSAHFKLVYPEWRADSLSKANDSKYSEWTYPCAGVDYGAGNVTDWPLDGGSLTLDLHHPWTYIFVNLGLGRNTTNFNVSLTPEFWNSTGKGTLCIEKVAVPINVDDGALASLQIVTVGETGSALYNCADIRFKKDAKTLANCTSDDIKYAPVREQKDNGTGPSGNNGGGNNGGGNNKTSDAATFGVDTLALGAAVAGLASAFAVGLGV